MSKTITLSAYVKKRNGVPIGAPDSLTNMLKHSLGASSFSAFWRYWNPIWGYYLSRYIMTPLSKYLPIWLATVLTFAVSGALHDIAVSLIKFKLIYFFTPWFAFMGGVVVVTNSLKLSFAQFPFAVKAVLNITTIVTCYFLAQFFIHI